MSTAKLTNNVNKGIFREGVRNKVFREYQNVMEFMDDVTDIKAF